MITMKKFFEALSLKYTIRREYFTVLIPVAVAVLIVVIAYFSGIASLPGNEKQMETSDRQKAYEELLKQMEAEESTEELPAAIEEEPKSPASTIPLDHIIVIATIVAIVPYALDITLEKRRIRRKEELYTEFLFKLSELMRGASTR